MKTWSVPLQKGVPLHTLAISRERSHRRDFFFFVGLEAEAEAGPGPPFL